jgi:hypothetical protein
VIDSGPPSHSLETMRSRVGSPSAANTGAGRERLWTLRAERLVEARRYLDQISQQWDAAIERLRAFVELESP